MLRQRNKMTTEMLTMLEGLISGPNEDEQLRLAALSKKRFTLIYLRSLLIMIILSILIVILNGESIIANLNTLFNMNITVEKNTLFTQR